MVSRGECRGWLLLVPGTQASQQLELGWDNKFHTYRRKFFSDVTSLMSGANWSSVEKLKR
jgi:hypothetical protein